MNDTVRESLSALMDGEATELELRRILASDDPAIRQQWSEMHRNQALLQEQGIAYPELDVSASVMAAIEEDKAPSSGGLKQTLSGLAVAASVAAVVVVGSMGTSLFDGQSSAVVAENVSSGRVYPAQAAPASGGVPVNAQTLGPVPVSADQDAKAKEHFEALLRKHTDRAAHNNGQGLTSYARVVGQESE